MKLVRLSKKYWPNCDFGHWCPGCNNGHEINIVHPNSSGAKWSFNGNMERPTFTPSINLKWGKFAGQKDTECGGVCHYFITDGRIQFCGDCTHALAGQTVDLPDIPAGQYVSCGNNPRGSRED